MAKRLNLGRYEGGTWKSGRTTFAQDRCRADCQRRAPRSGIHCFPVSRGGDLVSVQEKSGAQSGGCCKGTNNSQPRRSGREVSQTSANQAQASSNLATYDAEAAGAATVMDAAAVQMVNRRVSDLDNYNTVAEAVNYSPIPLRMGSTLVDVANANLAILAAYINGGLRLYIIDIAGYASTTGTKQLNQKLHEERG